jgi:diaminopimelate epimerase
MRMTKHHGLGNDFLVVLDPGGVEAVDADFARALCDRRRGVGADGLIHGVVGDGERLAMTLWNADGSLAEMSGNGIRCLVQAEAMRRGVTRLSLDVATAAGVRHVEVRPGPDERTVMASVDMGPVVEYIGGLHLHPTPLKQLAASVGNPHVVALYDDRTTRDEAIERLAGRRVDANAELIVVDEVIDMRVVERGVGETEACGTGACAAAWAADHWGLVDGRATVRMRGGDAEVVLGDTVTLTGPATYVALVEV